MSPKKWWLTTVAATEEITMGVSREGAKSPRMTSAANRVPAMGALKVAAIPAAAPQATRVRSLRSPRFSNCPMLDPRAEPICTMGPSLPTDPPVPMQIPEATSLAATTRARILPPRNMTASITSGTPCPLASLAKKWTINPTTSPPAAGTRITYQWGCARTPSRVNSGICQAWTCTKWMNLRKPTAHSPPSSPTATASRIIIVWWDCRKRKRSCCNVGCSLMLMGEQSSSA